MKKNPKLKFILTNMRIHEISGNAKYRKNEQFQNLTIFFQILVILEIS